MTYLFKEVQAEKITLTVNNGPKTIDTVIKQVLSNTT